MLTSTPDAKLALALQPFRTPSRTMHKIALPLVACLLAAAATTASAQSFWKWRDASGQLHLSDTAPPPGTPANAILQRPAGGGVAPAAAAPAAAASGASAPESELQKKKKKADQDKADQAASDKAAIDQKNASIRRENCQRAQNEIAGLQAGNRMSTLNASGEREAMDDAARAAETKRVQEIAAQNCGAAPAAQ